jgi:hypothetical protein
VRGVVEQKKIGGGHPCKSTASGIQTAW